MGNKKDLAINGEKLMGKNPTHNDWERVGFSVNGVRKMDYSVV